MTKEEIVSIVGAEWDGFPTVPRGTAYKAMDAYARQEAIAFAIWTMRNAYYLTQKSRWYMYPTNPAYNIEGHTDEQIFEIFQQQKQK